MRFWLYALVWFMSSSYIEVQSSPIQILLKEKVSLSKTAVLMEDIADITVQEDEATENLLKKLHISKAPRVGQKVRIGRARIKYLVERKFPQQSFPIDWLGAEIIHVTTLGQVYSYKNMQQTAKSLLQTFLAKRFSKFEIAENEAVRNVMLPKGKIKVAPRLDKKLINRRMVVWTDIYIDKKHYQSVPIWFEVRVWSKVPVLTKDKPVHSVLHKDDFAYQERDISRINSLPVKPKVLMGKRLNQALNKGSIILNRHIEAIPAVVKGKDVKVHASSGSVALQITGIAMEDGDLGNWVKVKNPSSGEVFQAYVVKINEVTTDKRYAHD